LFATREIKNKPNQTQFVAFRHAVRHQDEVEKVPRKSAGVAMSRDAARRGMRHRKTGHPYRTSRSVTVAL
jgi:hypothetical protein